MIQDLKGQRFDRLVALRRGSRLLPDGKRVGIWLCRCDCGTELWVRTSSLVNGNTRSCGCSRTKAGHTTGHVRSPTYDSWMAMKQRCSNPKNVNYRLYGQRGIKVCKRWLGKRGFENFLADMGERPEGKTIDRKKNNKNYTPKNCRWATAAEQMQNTRIAKMNPVAVTKIRKLVGQGFKHRTIAMVFGIDRSVVSRIANNKAWRAT